MWQVRAGRTLIRTVITAWVLSSYATLFGGCFAQFILDSEDMIELKKTRDRNAAFFLFGNDIVDAKKFQYVYGTDSTDGILGKGRRIANRTGEEAKFIGFLPMAEIDSLTLLEGEWRCRVRGGTLVSIPEAEAIRVTASSHPGFWIAGASQRNHPGILFRGFLPDSTIAAVKVDKVSLVGTVLMVAIMSFTGLLLGLGLSR